MKPQGPGSSGGSAEAKSEKPAPTSARESAETTPSAPTSGRDTVAPPAQVSASESNRSSAAANAAKAAPKAGAMDLRTPLKVDPQKEVAPAFERAKSPAKPPQGKALNLVPEAIVKDQPPQHLRMRTPIGDAVDRQAFNQQSARDRQAAKGVDNKKVEKPPVIVQKATKPPARDWSKLGLTRDFSNSIDDDGGKQR